VTTPGEIGAQVRANLGDMHPRASLAIANPYWEAIRPSLGLNGHRMTAGVPLLPSDPAWERSGWFFKRRELTGLYAWTISSPGTVDFVLAHCGTKVIDPLAGTGYWAWILEQAGVQVKASDLHPPTAGGSTWHPAAERTWVPVSQCDALEAIDGAEQATLLLSWPPYDSDLGLQIVKRYRGQRIIYMGEEDGSCATPEMFEALDKDFRAISVHAPVQWWGLHDEVVIYDRIGS